MLAADREEPKWRSTTTHLCDSKRIITNRGHPHDRHYLAPLRNLPLLGKGSPWAWSQRPGLGIGRDPRHHAEARPDGADGRLSQDASAPDRRRHLLR